MARRHLTTILVLFLTLKLLHPRGSLPAWLIVYHTPSRALQALHKQLRQRIMALAQKFDTNNPLLSRLVLDPDPSALPTTTLAWTLLSLEATHTHTHTHIYIYRLCADCHSFTARWRSISMKDCWIAICRLLQNKRVQWCAPIYQRPLRNASVMLTQRDECKSCILSSGRLTRWLQQRQGKDCIVFLDEFEKVKGLASHLGWDQSKKIYQGFLEPWQEGTVDVTNHTSSPGYKKIFECSGPEVII